MRLYALISFLAALCIIVPWTIRNTFFLNAYCEVLVWLWLAWGACLGWIAKLVLTESSVGAPPAPLHLPALGAIGACGASLLPPTLGAVPALGALYWAVAGPFAVSRTALIAWEMQETARTGSTWSLAADGQRI